MKTNESSPLTLKLLVIAIVVLVCFTGRADTMKYAHLDGISITLDLPDVMFTCQEWPYLRLIIVNNSGKPYRCWKNAMNIFAIRRARLEIENIEGDALGGYGTAIHSWPSEKWHEGKYEVVEPGDRFEKVYLINPDILFPNEPGVARVRLKVRDLDTGEMVAFNEEIVEVQKLEDAEREVVAEESISEGKTLSVERIRTSNGNTELIILPRKTNGEVAGLVTPLFDIPPESKIELILGKSQVHVFATSGTGKQYYTRLAGVDTFRHEEFNDGKKRSLKKLPDGSVELEVVGGDDDSAEEFSEADLPAPEPLTKTNNVASISKSGTNTPTPQKSQPAASKKTAPEAARSPLVVAIIAGLTILLLGIALFIVRRLSSRNSS